MSLLTSSVVGSSLGSSSSSAGGAIVNRFRNAIRYIEPTNLGSYDTDLALVLDQKVPTNPSLEFAEYSLLTNYNTFSSKLLYDQIQAETLFTLERFGRIAKLIMYLLYKENYIETPEITPMEETTIGCGGSGSKCESYTNENQTGGVLAVSEDLRLLITHVDKYYYLEYFNLWTYIRQITAIRNLRPLFIKPGYGLLNRAFNILYDAYIFPTPYTSFFKYNTISGIVVGTYSGKEEEPEPSPSPSPEPEPSPEQDEQDTKKRKFKTKDGRGIKKTKASPVLGPLNDLVVLYEYFNNTIPTNYLDLDILIDTDPNVLNEGRYDRIIPYIRFKQSIKEYAECIINKKIIGTQFCSTKIDSVETIVSRDAKIFNYNYKSEYENFEHAFMNLLDIKYFYWENTTWCMVLGSNFIGIIQQKENAKEVPTSWKVSAATQGKSKLWYYGIDPNTNFDLEEYPPSYLGNVLN